MNWKKMGRIISINDFEFEWMHSHTQLPIPMDLDDGKIRVFFNSRTNGMSMPTFVDIDMKTYMIINKNSRPLLELGRRGTFDDSGVMFSSFVKHNNMIYMYYSGWNVPSNVRYHNSIGLAISEDNGETFHKYSDGPIIDRCINIPIMAAGPYVIKDDNEWLMYYLSCSEWIDGVSKVEPVYNIHYAKSYDGIHWDIPEHSTCIKGEDEAIAQPCVLKMDSCYHMWYSRRGIDDYRTNKMNSYRIGYAKSEDGVHWDRMDEVVGIDVSDYGWDSEMIEYPYVIKEGHNLLMFYNGNGFGQSGIGCASAVIDH